MARLIIILIFLVYSNVTTAQHIGYRDRTKIPVKTVVKDTVKVAIKDTVKIEEDETDPEIVTPNTECPGMDASLPVLMNYVPAEIVDNFKKKFEGHVYSITSIKVSANQFQYKLKVCYNGEFVFRYVDTDGDILR